MTTATAPSVPFPLPLLNNPAPAPDAPAAPTAADGVSVGAVAIETHGCKLNQADSAVLARQFAQAGCRLVDAPAHADIVIVNTCTVTAAADAKARQALRAARRQNPQAIVIAAGCYPQRAAAELRRMPEISLVAGNQDKPRLVALALAELARQRGPRPTLAPGAGNTDTDADTNIATDTYAPADSSGNAAPAGILRRSRAMLKNPGRLRPGLRLLHRPQSARPRAQHPRRRPHRRRPRPPRRRLPGKSPSPEPNSAPTASTCPAST